MSSVGRPRVHDDQTRLELLAAAERLIAERGLDGLSVRAAAEAASTSTRAVYALFGSKEQLVQALAQHAFELLMEAVAAVPQSGAPGDDLVRASVFGFRRFALEHPQLFHLFFTTQMQRPRLSAETDATRVAALAQLIQLVERAKAAGLLGTHSVQQVTLLWDVMCVGLAAREFCWLIPSGQSEQVWTDALRALLAGLGATRATVPQSDLATTPAAAS